MAMRRISVLVLLSLVKRAHAREPMDMLFDKLVHKLSDKLVDRALQEWSIDRGGLDDTTCEKPEARPGMRLGAAGSNCKTTPAWIARLQSTPFLHGLSRAFKPAESEAGATAETAAHVGRESVDIPHLHVPTLLPIIPLSISQNGGGPSGENLEYIARLAAVPGVLPTLINPEEAAAMHLAGRTPVETPVETPMDSPRGEAEGHTDLSSEFAPRGEAEGHTDLSSEFAPQEEAVGPHATQDTSKTQLIDGEPASDKIISHDHLQELASPRNDLSDHETDEIVYPKLRHDSDDIWWLENGEPLFIGDGAQEASTETQKLFQNLLQKARPPETESASSEFASKEEAPPETMDAPSELVPQGTLKTQPIEWSDTDSDTNIMSASSKDLADDIQSDHHPLVQVPTTSTSEQSQAVSGQRHPLLDPFHKIDPNVRKIDPEDGQAYSFHDLYEWYKGMYSEKEIKAYWTNECKQI